MKQGILVVVMAFGMSAMPAMAERVKCVVETEDGQRLWTATIGETVTVEEKRAWLLKNGTYGADGRTLRPVTRVVECVGGDLPFGDLEALEVERACGEECTVGYAD